MAHSHTDETDLIREIALTRRHLRTLPRHPRVGGVAVVLLCVCVVAVAILLLAA